jgi:hypothetical protein
MLMPVGTYGAIGVCTGANAAVSVRVPVLVVSMMLVPVLALDTLVLMLDGGCKTDITFDFPIGCKYCICKIDTIVYAVISSSFR